jgi:hypothetical protein
MKDTERAIHIIVSLIFLNVLVFVMFQSEAHAKREFARGYIQAEKDILDRSQFSTWSAWQRYGENIQRMMEQEAEQIRMASEMELMEWIWRRHNEQN